MTRKKFENYTIAEFLEELSDKRPTPGGGSASALAGAMAAALLSMFCQLTMGKKKYQSVQEQMETANSEAQNLMNKLLELTEKDSQFFDKVIASRSDPEAYQSALKEAALVPMEVAELSSRIFALASQASGQGNQATRSDAQTSICLAKAAVMGALANVVINLSSIEDEEFCGNLYKRIEEILELVNPKENY